MKIGIGTKFNSGYADGMATWEVVRSRGANTWDCEIVAPSLDGLGVQKVFGGEEIERALKRAAHFSRVIDENTAWWSARKVGEIVHYHNGFGQFVRGEIVDVNGEKKMRPIALVGNYREYDLPIRNRDGSINHRQASTVAKGEPFAPNYGNMYESDPRSTRFSLDPRPLEPIDLTVPEMTPEQAASARLERARLDAITALQNGYSDPEAALRAVRAQLDAVL